MSEQKIIIQQNLGRTQGYQELWPKTDCYTKEETNQLIQSELPSVDWQIGDVRTTVKTDLDDNWHLCDGSVINSSDLSELTEYLSDNGPYLTSQQIYDGILYGGTYFLEDGIYYNGIYAFVAIYSGQIAVYYSTSLENTLTKVSVASVSSSYTPQDLKIQVNNGVYQISCKHNKYIYSWYSTDLVNWTQGSTITSASTGQYQSTVLNGYWIFIDRYFIWSSSASIPSSWTQYSGNSSFSYLGINYFDSKYWLLYATNTDYTVLHYASFTDITNPLGGGYTTYDCSISFSSYMSSYIGWANIYKKEDGYYLLYSIPNSNNFYTNCFSFTKDLINFPFSTDGGSFSGSLIQSKRIKEIGQGIFVPTYNNTSYYNGVVGNQKSNKISEDINSYYWINIRNTNYYSIYTISGQVTTYQLNYINSTVKLPTITVDQAKAYIKVK